MKTRLGLTAILMLIALMSTVSGYSSMRKLEARTLAGTAVSRVREALSAVQQGTTNLALQRNGSFRVAEEVDLRSVDWSKVSDDTASTHTQVILVADNGDDDEDKGDDDEGGDGGDEEEGGGEGGWDRTWDAPKLG